ncbi:hypothetical protein [Paenibacillus albus]|uniref:hypothetical protein n=1 Tax=Paenibacillus albus TaxID=2495582 RepID=UPI0013DF2E0B|nr:hypothetical protein [Paenibacillus albus]
MRELVGQCQQCGNAVYCDDGFLNGMILENGALICSDCADEHNESNERKYR